jgi:gas vesicle protein
MNDNGKIVVGVLAGLIAGAAIGFLLAPEKGSEIRDKINDGLKSVADDIQKKIYEQIDFLKDKKSEIKHVADEFHEDFVA